MGIFRSLFGSKNLPKASEPTIANYNRLEGEYKRLQADREKFANYYLSRVDQKIAFINHLPRYEVTRKRFNSNLAEMRAYVTSQTATFEVYKNQFLEGRAALLQEIETSPLPERVRKMLVDLHNMHPHYYPISRKTFDILMREYAAHSVETTKAPPSPENAQPKPLQSVTVGIALDGENLDQPLFLEPSLRVRHLYLIGKTRTGKTTLIKNLALQDMEMGNGVCFVDPHGDAAEDLISSLPKHRLKDVIYFDPSSEYAPSFNILRLPYPPHKLTEDTISVFKMFFESWGQRLEHLLRYSFLTLLNDQEPHALKDLRLLLVNSTYRAEIVRSITDESLREFWEMEFPTMSKDATSPIINRLSSFLASGSHLLKLFSQPENDLDFSAILNTQKILIVNLAKGILGEEPSRLLGGLIVTGIQQAALARAEIPPEQRKEFHLYLDEFQNFIVASFESILSESAKYKLYLTLAHQPLGQVPRSLEAAIFGNVATLVAFPISAEDAATMKKEMHRTRHVFSQKKTNEPANLHEVIQARRVVPLFNYFNNLDAAEGFGTSDYAETCRRRAEEYKEQFDTLTNLLTVTHPDRPAIQKLIELFPDYAFRETTFPDTDDFMNQKPHHAFCRRERAENVTVFRTLPAPDPNPETKKLVLEETRARYQQRAQKKEAPKQEEKITAAEALSTYSPGGNHQGARQEVSLLVSLKQPGWDS